MNDLNWWHEGLPPDCNVIDGPWILGSLAHPAVLVRTKTKHEAWTLIRRNRFGKVRSFSMFDGEAADLGALLRGEAH